MEIIENHCPVCMVRIFDFCPTCNRRGMALSNQCQFPVLLDDGSTFDIGCCQDCFRKITPDQVDELFTAHKRWWSDNGYDAKKDCVIEKILLDQVDYSPNSKKPPLFSRLLAKLGIVKQ